MKRDQNKRAKVKYTQRRDGEPAHKKMPLRGPVLVQLEKPVYGGAFLARAEGKAVFVPLALPGERVRVQLVDERRSYANAEIVSIEQPSAERIDPACRHFGVCGGCSYQHTSYANQGNLKKAILRETLERGGVQVPIEIGVLAAEAWGYRNRVRLAMDAFGNVGYRGRRSHTVVAIEECPIAAPLLMRAAMVFKDLVRAEKPSLACDEISLFCTADESQLLCSVALRHGSAEAAVALAKRWTQATPEVTGVQFTQNEGGARRPRIIAEWGEPALEYAAAGSHYRVDHGAFFQVNRWLIDSLVHTVTAGLSGEVAWDLYAGVGLFAQPLARSFGSVVAVESAPESTRALRHNLETSGGQPVIAHTLEFLRSHNGTRPDAVIVDPPRTGLGSEVTALLDTVGAPQLVYVSCDPATLARDLRALGGSGYVIEKVTLTDLFPQTSHLETIVHLRRA